MGHGHVLAAMEANHLLLREVTAYTHAPILSFSMLPIVQIKQRYPPTMVSSSDKEETLVPRTAGETDEPGEPDEPDEL